MRPTVAPFDSVAYALAAALLAASLCVTPAGAVSFIRGDTTRDTRVDITDPVRLLEFLFGGAPPPACEDGADANDDGRLGLSDAVLTLVYLFQSGGALPPPFPDPGEDPTDDSLCCGTDGDATPHVDDERFPLPGDDAPPLAASLQLTGRPARDPSLDDAEGLEGGGALARDPEELPRAWRLVPAETFDAFDALGAGRPFVELVEFPGAIDVIAALEERARRSGPTAVGARVLVPIEGPSDCWTVTPDIVAGGSRGGSRGDSEGSAARFLRGDVNSDGRVDFSDVERFAACLALGAACDRDCADAWDVNDDGVVNDADRSWLEESLLGYDGRAIPEPSGRCGVDPTTDALPSCSSSPCPSPSDLEVDVWPEELCGAGTHEVLVTARDPDGRTSSAVSLVTLCAEKGSFDLPACPDEPVVTSPGGSEGPYRESCLWLGTVRLVPEERRLDRLQKVFTERGELLDVLREPPFAGPGPQFFCVSDNGPGPIHSLYGTRRNPTCYTPKHDLEKVRYGRIEIRVNVICMNERGEKVLPTCSSAVHAEAAYESLVAVVSDSGPPCCPLWSPIECLAQDETRFTANSSLVFAKAATVQNGNRVTISPSYDVTGSVAVGEGLSAGLQVRFGISQTILESTGASSDLLNAFGGARPELPAVLTLESKGTARMRADRRASGKTRVDSRHAGMWLTGTSTCPDAGNIAVWVILARPEEIWDPWQRASDFFFTELGIDIGPPR